MVQMSRFCQVSSDGTPDEALIVPDEGGDPIVDLNAPYLELLGPTNGLIRQLEEAKIFNANHLSIITRIVWRRFRMIIAGDAQLENWAYFDSERLMEDPCQVLRTAHHGSPNGTQWERIKHINASLVVVSSNPHGGHHLPDLTSTAIFTKYNKADNRMAVITKYTGTIYIQIPEKGRHSVRRFDEEADQFIDFDRRVKLTPATNPTEWLGLLNDRVASL